MATASEMLRDEAPEAFRRREEIDAQLAELSSMAADYARRYDLWAPSAVDERYLDAVAPGNEYGFELRGSGILGTAVTRIPGAAAYTPAVFVRLSRPTLLVSLDPEDSPELRDYWQLLEMLHVVPGDGILIALPEPIAQVGPSDPAYCNAPPGTFGARVQTRSGARGILTAGHVAPRMNSSAYTSNSSWVGTVVESHDIATLSPRRPGIDVAVVEMNPTVLDTGQAQLSSLRQAQDA